ncbi:MAG: hypothetical protein KKC79_13950 [Gammaproteobacteria bacterium]|nr:hypothetical protein [Gammaproteobacteria bacterium]MBU1440048.1 hypothetical protein [Gammaproteobacteria bacterium]MBU2285541.1 hypothetical protein [Gammaproteobacteria bacterium]MBU2409737.1 hypothetical protein [Gammaproteobacteria bacterium]
MDFAIVLALLSLLAATFLSNLLARRRDRLRRADPLTTEVREILFGERVSPAPLGPTLSAEHWAHLEASQPRWRRPTFETSRARYFEARESFVRDELDGRLYYPDPHRVTRAAHDVLLLTERF